MTRHEYQQRAVELAARGTRLPQSKLDDAKVREIRATHVPFSRTDGAPAIARRLGLHQRTVEKVLSFETWRHVR